MNQRFEVGVQIEGSILFSTLWVIIDGYGKQLTAAGAAKVAVLRAQKRGYLATGLTFGARAYSGMRDAGYYSTKAPD